MSVCFSEGFGACLNFALMSNDLNVLESLFPIKNFLNCVINDDGETLILRALKYSKNELVMEIISKYYDVMEVHTSFVNMVNGWTCFHYIASQCPPHVLHSQINVTMMLLSYSWELAFENSLLPCKFISDTENLLGIFYFFYLFSFFINRSVKYSRA
jgi:hypothetical protein